MSLAAERMRNTWAALRSIQKQLPGSRLPVGKTAERDVETWHVTSRSTSVAEASVCTGMFACAENTEQTSTNVRSRFPIFKLVLHSNFLRVCLSFGHENENREEKESDLVKMTYVNNAGDNVNHTLDKPKLHLHTITCTHVIPLMMNSPISAPLKRSNTTRGTRVGWNPSQISVVEKHLLCDMRPNFCAVRTHLLSYGNHSILFLAEWGATPAE